MIDFTSRIVEHVHASRFERLPPEIRHQGVRAFVNWIGCAAGGAREAPVDIALKTMQEFGGAGEATVIGRSEKADVLTATFVNAMSSNVLMFHDTHFATVAHPTTPVASALLALSQRSAISGAEFLHALILGIEIQCRVGMLFTVPPAKSSAALSMGGLVGAIGAAVGTGKALRLDRQQLTVAVGLAANQAAGLRQAHASMTNHYTPAHAARAGLLSALLATRGFTASADMLEGDNGFAIAYAENPSYEAALSGLGATYEIAELSYKPYPCGFASHGVIDTCLDIAQHDVEAARVERVEIKVHPLAAKLMDRPRPQTRDEAIASLQYWAAAALVFKAAGLAQTRDAAVSDARVRMLIPKVALRTDASIARGAAEVRVLLDDGRTFEQGVQDCRGSAARPLTDDDLSVKSRGQLMTVFSTDASARIVDECWRFAEYADASRICAELATVSGE